MAHRLLHRVPDETEGCSNAYTPVVDEKINDQHAVSLLHSTPREHRIQFVMCIY